MCTMKHIHFTSLFYIGVLLITFDGFPFPKYGLGSAKSLSLIPMGIFLIFNLKNVFVALKKTDKIELFLILILLLISALVGMNRYADISGFEQSVSMWACYIIALLSFRLFIFNANRSSIFKMFKLINRSFTISLVFGILECFLIYAGQNTIFSSFLSLFLRDDNYLGNRLQFNFQEPSSCAIMLLCFYIPTLYSLKKMGYHFSLFDKTKCIMLFVFSIAAFSSMFFLTLLVLTIAYAIYKIIELKRVKYLIYVFLFTMLLSPLILTWLKGYNDGRVYDMVFSPIETIEKENSAGTRAGLWFVSVEAMKDYPLTGYGWGYFWYAFRNNFHKIGVNINSTEFAGILFSKSYQSYSIYSTAIVEGGLVGTIWLLLLLYSRYRETEGFYKPFYFGYLFILIQIIPIYSITYMFVLFILTDKRINRFVLK